jgi:hypothetical protein
MEIMLENMRLAKIFGRIVISTILLLPPSYASDRSMSGDSITASQSKLVTAYIKASRLKDTNQMRALYYAPSFSCNPKYDNRPIDSFLDARLDYNIPDDYQVGVSKRTSEKGLLDKLVKEDISEYVIEPSHEITIALDTRDESRGFKIVEHFLHFDILSIDDKWYFIYEC